jgi:hypothetical protein
MSEKKDKKKKKKDKGEGSAAEQAVPTVSITAHPRAKASIRRTRARVALVTFGLVLFLSLNAGVTGQEAAVRALVGGLVGNLAGWACALAVWRMIVMQELRTVEDGRRERARVRAEAASAAAAAAADAA